MGFFSEGPSSLANLVLPEAAGNPTDLADLARPEVAGNPAHLSGSLPPESPATVKQQRTGVPVTVAKLLNGATLCANWSRGSCSRQFRDVDVLLTKQLRDIVPAAADVFTRQLVTSCMPHSMASPSNSSIDVVLTRQFRDILLAAEMSSPDNLVASSKLASAIYSPTPCLGPAREQRNRTEGCGGPCPCHEAETNAEQRSPLNATPQSILTRTHRVGELCSGSCGKHTFARDMVVAAVPAPFVGSEYLCGTGARISLIKN